MTLKIYGVARSRAFRTLWMAKELGLDYEHVKVDFATGETRTPAHLALNPNGQVPVIDDNGFVLWESMAINLNLAKKYGVGTLYPTRLEVPPEVWTQVVEKYEPSMKAEGRENASFFIDRPKIAA